MTITTSLASAREQVAAGLVLTVEGRGGAVWYDPNEGKHGTLWIDLIGSETLDLRASIEANSDAVIDFLMSRHGRRRQVGTQPRAGNGALRS